MQRLGEAGRKGSRAGAPPIEQVLAETGRRALFERTIVSVESRNEGGWTMGQIMVAGTRADIETAMKIDLQNEHLVDHIDDVVGATVPDLIMVVDQDSAEPIPAEEVRYGQRITVLGLPCDARWRTEKGLALAGPRRFGYDVDFWPIGATKS